LRDYGIDAQLGLEPTPEEYVANMVAVFREVRRVLRDDGTVWLNIGDSYASGKGTCYNPGGGETSLGQERKAAGAHPLDRGNKSTLAAVGLKPKDLVGIPWRVAFALQADGWWLRSDIIWAKPNPMPESVTDRPTRSHEYLFLLTKSARYYYDAQAIAEPSQVSEKWHEPDAKYLSKTSGNGETSLRSGFNRLGEIGGTRNRRDVWTITTKPFKGAHFATMPPDLAEICIKAGSAPGDVVLDPFSGAGTTVLVATQLAREGVGVELSAEYNAIATERVGIVQPMLEVFA